MAGLCSARWRLSAAHCRQPQANRLRGCRRGVTSVRWRLLASGEPLLSRLGVCSDGSSPASADVVGQRASGRVTILGPQSHSLQADCLEGLRHFSVHVRWCRNSPIVRGQAKSVMSSLEKVLGPCQEVVKRGAEAVDVGGGALVGRACRRLALAHELGPCPMALPRSWARSRWLLRDAGWLRSEDTGASIGHDLGQPQSTTRVSP